MTEPAATIPRVVALRSSRGHWEAYAEADTGKCATGERPVHALARLCTLLGVPTTRYTIAESGPGRVVYVHRDDSDAPPGRRANRRLSIRATIKR